jgi:xylulokinase
MPVAIMGLDIGTTGCKSTVLSPSGKVLASRYLEYEAKRAAGLHEMDAEEVWRCVKTVVSAAAQQSAQESGEEVDAIGISSFGESAVPVDENGNPLACAILYTDPRGLEQTQLLCERLGEGRIAALTGLPPNRMYTLPKLMWFKAFRPEIYRKAYKFLLFEDYILFRLTGECVIDYSLASRTMCFDLAHKGWSGEMLEAAGIDGRKLSRPVPSGTVAGEVIPALAAELHLGAHTRAVTGGHDQVCASLGAGVLVPGLSVDGTGTVECIAPAVGRIPDSETLRAGGYACAPHAVPGLYLVYAFSFTGGVLLKWFRDTLARGEYQRMRAAGNNFYRMMDERAAAAGPSPLLALPHFAGAATPYMDESATGALVGLTLETRQEDVYRALMEGVTFEMLLNLEMLEKGGIHVRELRATGGGASSALWLQIKADITGLPVLSLANCEAGTIGAVMLAGCATGRYSSLTEASAALLKTGRTFLPDQGMHERYMEQYARYRRLYGALQQIDGKDL